MIGNAILIMLLAVSIWVGYATIVESIEENEALEKEIAEIEKRC